MHVVGLRILWRIAGWLRSEAAVVVLHKVGGGVVFDFKYLIKPVTVTVTTSSHTHTS